jgi:hypothetical protein
VTAGAPLSYPSLRQSKWSAVDDACGRVDAGAAATFGLRYVFATLDQKQFSLQTRVNYVLSPKMSLQVYVQLRVSVGDYVDFQESARPRTFDFVRYGIDRGTLTHDAAAKRDTVDTGHGGAPFTFGPRLRHDVRRAG